jgi:hypothetical protein
MSDGSPKIQEIDDYEGDNHANDAPDQHVTNIVQRRSALAQK